MTECNEECKIADNGLFYTQRDVGIAFQSEVYGWGFGGVSIVLIDAAPVVLLEKSRRIPGPGTSFQCSNLFGFRTRCICENSNEYAKKVFDWKRAYGR